MLDRGINKMVKSEFLYGYVEDKRVLIRNDVEQICAFLMKYRFQNVKITNVLGITEVNTYIGVIDYCADQQYLVSVLNPAYTTMQSGKVPVPKYVEYGFNEKNSRS